MNKYQRAALIVAGIAIAVIQFYGIANDGLSDSRGWAISFLISAGLLFVGLGSWERFGSLFGRPAVHLPPVEKRTEQSRPIKSAPTEKPVKGEYGIHISELDLAIETHIQYANDMKLHGPLEGNGRSLRWNCCASIYGSMRYAARKTSMTVHLVVWNSIKHAIVVRMTVDEIDGVGLGHPDYAVLEQDAYNYVELIDRAVDDVLASKGSYPLEPLVQRLGMMFGTQAGDVKALAAIALNNADRAHKKILPELLESFA